MPDINVDINIDVQIPINIFPLIDNTDFKTIENTITYNQAGMDLVWNFITSSGVETQTSVVPAISGDYTWTNLGKGMYSLQVPAISGASINNDSEGYGWFTGECTGVLPWRSHVICFRDATINDALIDGGDNLDVNLSKINEQIVSATSAITVHPSIGLNSTAQAALENQYDGTGLTGDTYPATQAQVGKIAIAGAAINTISESYTLTTGIQSSGTYTDTQTLDGVSHQHTDSAGTLELYYQFDVGNDGVSTSVKVNGRVSGPGDDLGVYAYNWAGTSWDQIGTLEGSNSSINEINTYDLLTAHVGTGSNVGKVRIRYYATGLTTSTLYIDQILVSYALASAGIANGSTITLGSSTTNTNLIGRSWSLELGNQDITGSYIYQSISVTGIATGTNGSNYIFQECNIGDITIDAFGFFDRCSFGGNVTLSSTPGLSADTISIFDSFSGVAGSGTPIFTLSGITKTTHANIRNWHGGGEWIFNSFCTASLEISKGGNHNITTGGGNIEFRGTPKSLTLITSGSSITNIVVWSGCPITISGTGGTVNIYGIYGTITDNSSGTTVNKYGEDITNVATSISISAIDSKIDIIDNIVDNILIDTNISIPTTLENISSDLLNIQNDTNLIQNELDNTDQFKADTSNLAKELTILNISSDLLNIQNDTNSIESKVDIIDNIVDNILIDTNISIPTTLENISGDINNLDLSNLDVPISSRSAFDPLTDTVLNVATVENISGSVDITQEAADKVWNTSSRTLTVTGGSTAEDIWTYTTRSLTDKVDFELSSDSEDSIVDKTWDEIIPGSHDIVDSAGNKINSAASAGDPWSTTLPGSYGAGTAGKIIGDNINSPISDTALQSTVETISSDIKDIKGSGFDTNIHSLKEIKNRIG